MFFAGNNHIVRNQKLEGGRISRFRPEKLANAIFRAGQNSRS
jgi:hypothetical protein